MAVEAWTFLAAGVVGLALAATLYVRADKLIVWALASVVLARAVLDLFQALASWGLDPGPLVPAAHVVVPWTIAGFAVLHYAEKPPWKLVTFLGVGAAVSAILVVAYPWLWLANGEFGPFFVSAGLVSLSYAFLALWLAMSYTQETPGRTRRSLGLMSLGFALLPAYTSGQELLIEAPPNLWVQLAHVSAIAGMVPIVLIIILLAKTAAETQDDAVKGDLARFIGALLLPWLTVGFLFLVRWGGDSEVATALALEGLWSLTTPVLVGLGLFTKPGRIGHVHRDGFEEHVDEYRAAYQAALVDGAINPREREHLEQLRLRLGLQKDVTNRVENEDS